MTTYKVIPQVDFDKAVQRILSVGLARTPAENIVLAFWKASQDLGKDFRKLIEDSTSSGMLDVEQDILDRLNENLPDTIKYYKNSPKKMLSLVAREM
jgi:hypothetical protein